MNYYIAILAVIALIGILFVPSVSGGKIINYGPIQGTVKTIPADQNMSPPGPLSVPPKRCCPVIPNDANQSVQPDTPASIVLPPTPDVPSTGIQSQPVRKISTPVFPFITPGIITNLIHTFTDPGATTLFNPVPGNMDLSYISKDVAIRIAEESFSNISLTSDPVATLTPQRVTYNIRSGGYTLKTPAWVVELSGVSTDPNAFGSLWYRNIQTGEVIFVPTHAGGSVTIDARSGTVLSVDRCM